MVSGFMASVKVALTAWLSGTLIAEFAGLVETNSGGMALTAALVVKVQT
jgi:hypothetical protein